MPSDARGHAAGDRPTHRPWPARSWALVLLVATAAGVGFFAEGVYRDNPLVRAGWRGNDLVTLLVAVPLLAISAVLARRGVPRGLLLWSGMEAYALYNFAFYLFGAAFNALFLAYVGILVLSTLGLIQDLTSPEMRRIVQAVRIAGAQRAVGAFVILVSLTLGLFWTMTSAGYLWTGQVPAMVTAVGHPTNVTGALDLWLVVSFGLLGGVWLWRRRAWGYVVATIWTVKGGVYMAALSAASVAAARAGATDDLTQVAVWAPIGAGCVAGAAVLLQACASPVPGAGAASVMQPRQNAGVQG